MNGMLTHKDVVKQSWSVYRQFGEQKWIPYAKENAKLPQKSCEELLGCGVGKTLVIAAMGESIEKTVPFLVKYRDRFDLMTCDKGFVPLLEHDLKADYVMICDCNIPAMYFERHLLHTEGTNLIATIYANPMWTKPWLGSRYFYINKDAIESERVFLPLSEKPLRVMAASSNVSNAMVVFVSGCDNVMKMNFMGYDRYLLVGYDYSWRPDGNYYGWIDPKPKRYYMNHRTILDMNNDIAFTSENLLFSAKWLYMYLSAHSFLPFVNCSERGLLEISKRSSLEKELSSINPDPRVREAVRSAYLAAREAATALERTKDTFTKTREVLSWQSAI